MTLLRLHDIVRANENRMSDGYRERASAAVEAYRVMQSANARRVAVRSIAWLDDWCGNTIDMV